VCIAACVAVGVSQLAERNVPADRARPSGDWWEFLDRWVRNHPLTTRSPAQAGLLDGVQRDSFLRYSLIGSMIMLREQQCGAVTDAATFALGGAMREHTKSWRAKADKLRKDAEGCSTPEARQAYLSLAASYEEMAERVDTRAHQPPHPAKDSK
jgi:hypothetical protein